MSVLLFAGGHFWNRTCRKTTWYMVAMGFCPSIDLNRFCRCFECEDGKTKNKKGIIRYL